MRLTRTVTADLVQDVWARHPAQWLDTYGRDPSVVAQVIDPAIELEKIETTCRWLSDQKRDLGGFLETFDYDWAYNPCSYRLAPEANWQARAFQQLSSLWLHNDPFIPLTPTAQPLSVDTLGKVVVRQSMVTSYEIMSPRYRPFEGLHFIIIPQSYIDFALLAWRGFAGWCQNGQGKTPGDAWQAVINDSALGRTDDSPDPCLIELIARDIAHPARDYDVSRPDAAGAIAEAVPSFARAVRLVGPDALTDFDRDLSYLLLDFSLSHELGHRVACHQPGGRNLTEELEADQIAFNLFLASWGWRSEVLETSPLNDLSTTLLGSVVFHNTIRLRMDIQSVIRHRLTEAFPETPWTGKLKWDGAETLRAQQSSTSFTDFLARVAKMGRSIDFDSLQSVVNLANKVPAYLTHVRHIISAIPLAEIRAAAGIAMELGTKDVSA